MSKKHLHSYIVSTLILAVLALGANTVSAHRGGQANPGYVGDHKGHLVTDSTRKCIKTSAWIPLLALEECGDLAKKSTPVKVATPEPQSIPAAPIRERVTFGANALFDIGSNDLKPAGKTALDEFAAKIKGLAANEIVVTGHTDSTGAASFNQVLSQRRADSVKAYLVNKGVRAELIKTVGRGISEPVADNRTAAGRAQNRRVEIDVSASRNTRP